MSITKTTLLLTATLGLATAACAQDSGMDASTTYDPNTEVLDATASDHFAAADLDANGGLDRTEFETFVRTKADSGEADYVSLAEGGELDVEFMTRDTNADGLLDTAEADTVKSMDGDMDDGL